MKEHLLLKGVTAINMTIFNLPRLSVDIDLDFVPNLPRKETMSAREMVSDIIRRHMTEQGYILSDASRFSHSLDAFHYYYINAAGNRDMIKIEINYSLRAHVFRPEDMFRKCTVFYATISAKEVNLSFSTEAIDKLSFSRIRTDLFPVLGVDKKFALEEKKRQAKEFIASVMKLQNGEKEYIERFISKEYRPELLFGDYEIVERIKTHPMALWKCRL